MEPSCGAPTLKGKPCRWSVSECPIASHKAARARGLKPQHRPARPVPEMRLEDDGLSSAAPFELDGLAERDIAETGWAVLEALTRGEMDQRAVAVVASVLRVLLAAGTSGIATEDALREVELRGLLMHGLPPRDEDEWSLMRATFSPEAIAEAQRWQEAT